MFDLEFHPGNRPGALAALGEATGRAGIPFEGGGVFSHDGVAIAHFLFRDGTAAAGAAKDVGIEVAAIRDATSRRPKQGTSGKLSAISRTLAPAGVNILVQYSGHQNQLALVCDDDELARSTTVEWAAEGTAPP